MFIIISSDTTARFHIVRHVGMYVPHAWTRTRTHMRASRQTQPPTRNACVRKEERYRFDLDAFFSCLALSLSLSLDTFHSAFPPPPPFVPYFLNRAPGSSIHVSRTSSRIRSHAFLARSLWYARTTHVRVPPLFFPLSWIILAILPLYRGIEASRDDR